MHTLDYFGYLLGKSLREIDSSEKKFELIDPKEDYDFSYKFSDVIGNLRLVYNEEKRNQTSIELNLSSQFVPKENLEKFIDECLITNKAFLCKSSPFKYLERDLGQFRAIFPEKEKINSDSMRIDINNKIFKTNSEFFKQKAEEDFIKGVKDYIFLPTTLLSSEYDPKLSDSGPNEFLTV